MGAIHLSRKPILWDRRGPVRAGCRGTCPSQLCLGFRSGTIPCLSSPQPVNECQPHSLIPQQGLKVADSSTATRWPQTTRKWPRGGWNSEHHGSFGQVSLILAKCFRICSLCRLLNNPARWASRWGGRQSSDYLCFAETESQMKRVIGVDMLSLTSPSPLTWGLSHTRLPLSP